MCLADMSETTRVRHRECRTVAEDRVLAVHERRCQKPLLSPIGTGQSPAMLWLSSVNSGGVETMAWKYVFLITGVTVAAIAYWLYPQVPDGYSSECARHLQITTASSNVVEALVGLVLVCSTFVCVIYEKIK